MSIKSKRSKNFFYFFIFFIFLSIANKVEATEVFVLPSSNIYGTITDSNLIKCGSANYIEARFGDKVISYFDFNNLTSCKSDGYYYLTVPLASELTDDYLKVDSSIQIYVNNKHYSDITISEFGDMIELNINLNTNTNSNNAETTTKSNPSSTKKSSSRSSSSGGYVPPTKNDNNNSDDYSDFDEENLNDEKLDEQSIETQSQDELLSNSQSEYETQEMASESNPITGNIARIIGSFEPNPIKVGVLLTCILGVVSAIYIVRKQKTR